MATENLPDSTESDGPREELRGLRVSHSQTQVEECVLQQFIPERGQCTFLDLTDFLPVDQNTGQHKAFPREGEEPSISVFPPQ